MWENMLLSVHGVRLGVQRDGGRDVPGRQVRRSTTSSALLPSWRRDLPPSPSLSLCRPSPIFLSYTFILNAVPGVISLAIAVIHTLSSHDCERQLNVHLLLLAALNAFMCAFAVHLCDPTDVSLALTPTSPISSLSSMHSTLTLIE